jgi:hypothetical protein
MPRRNALVALLAFGLASATSGCATLFKNTDPNFNPREDRIAEVQGAILRQRCTFAALVVRSNFRDEVTVYAVRSRGTTSERRLGFLSTGEEKVFCVTEGMLSPDGTLILAADAPPRRNQMGTYDIMDYMGLPMRPGSIFEVTILGNMWYLTDITYGQFRDAESIVFPQEKKRQ